MTACLDEFNSTTRLMAIKVIAKLLQVCGSAIEGMKNSSVKRQKGESQNGCYKKTKCAKFSEKRKIRKIWRALLSCNTRFEIPPFALLPTNYASVLFNPCLAIGLFLYPQKTSKNLWFSDVFRGYRKRPVA